MAKLWIMSDLHLESIQYPEFFRPDVCDFDVLIAAGDIWEADLVKGFNFLKRLGKRKPVIFVMGNHEHWHSVCKKNLEVAKILARKYGITLLDGDEAVIAGCRFIGCTLWTDYRLAGAIDRNVPTGEMIFVGNETSNRFLTADDVDRLHQHDLARLEALISKDDGKYPLITVTHHAPHPACLPTKAVGTWRAGNGASDLSHLTDAGKVHLWVHGHTHHCIDITRPNGTRIVSNAAGPGMVNPKFNDTLVVEVGEIDTR